MLLCDSTVFIDSSYFGASSLGAQILPVTLNCLLSVATANVYGWYNVFTNLYATPSIALGNLIV